jgi:hypothetical protein
MLAYYDGTAANPIYSFNQSPNTGLFRPGADVLAFSTTSTERMRILANGQFAINTLVPDAGDVLSAYGTSATLNWALNGYTTHVLGGGLYAQNYNAANGFNAMEGVTMYNAAVNTPSGVFGLAIANTGVARGVRGATNSTDGIGVYGAWPGGAGAGWAGLFIGDLGYTGWFGAASDIRLKKDITELDGALGIINKLNPVQYYFDTEKYPNAGFREDKSFGFIANEIELVIPELVKEKGIDLNGQQECFSKTEANGNVQNFKMVDYISLIPILTQGIQEQQQIIEKQQESIELLQLQLDSVIKRLEELENKNK